MLLYHVVPGRRDASEVLGSDQLRTLERGFIGIEVGAPDNGRGVFLVDDDPDAENPEITAVDVEASNGIVHVIDAVLRPVDL